MSFKPLVIEPRAVFLARLRNCNAESATRAGSTIEIYYALAAAGFRPVPVDNGAEFAVEIAGRRLIVGDDTSLTGGPIPIERRRDARLTGEEAGRDLD